MTLTRASLARVAPVASARRLRAHSGHRRAALAGQRFLVNSVVGAQALQVLLNWSALLKEVTFPTRGEAVHDAKSVVSDRSRLVGKGGADADGDPRLEGPMSTRS